MRILAIDPGNEKSAYVVYDTATKLPVRFGIEDNWALHLRFHGSEFDDCDNVAIEMIACYGMAVGKSVFDTCVWIGRFAELTVCGNFVYRKDVKMHLCNSMRAKDANIRQAIIDRYESTGGGKTPQIGTKAQPGPLYGVSKDVWAALGVAITYAETKT